MRTGSLRDIATTYGLVFAALVAGTGVAVYFGTEIALNAMIDARIARTAARLIGPARPVDIDAVAARVKARGAERSIAETGFILVDAGGRRRAGRLGFRPAGFGYADVQFTDGSARLHRGRALMTPLGGGAWLAVVAENEGAEDFRDLFTRILMIALGAAVLAGVGGGYALSATIGRRMRGVQSTAQAIIAGDLTRRIPLDGSGSEFDRQAETLNQMLDRISELLVNLQQVSNDLAHDLRTPLARLRNDLESALDGDKAALRVGVKSAIAQADELLSLFSALLRISEIEAGKRKSQFARIDFIALVADIAETFAPAIEDAGRTLRFSAPTSATIRGDQELLTQMVINVVENAARHTPVGTTVSVSVDRDGEQIVLTVTDNGPGIPPTDYAVVLRRFTRLESSRSTAGHGLGLALVAAIARLHDGSITLADNSPGLRFSVALPAPEDLAPATGNAATPHLPVHPQPGRGEEHQGEPRQDADHRTDRTKSFA